MLPQTTGVSGTEGNPSSLQSKDNFQHRVERVEVKDVRLPQQLQRAMAAEAEGEYFNSSLVFLVA